MTDSLAAPVVDTLADMTAASLARCDLDEQTLVLVRIAALAAVGAPPSSYLLNLGAGVEVGLSIEDVEAVLVAVAPIVGAPKVIAASDAMHDALGFAIAVAEAEVLDIEEIIEVEE